MVCASRETLQTPRSHCVGLWHIEIERRWQASEQARDADIKKPCGSEPSQWISSHSPRCVHCAVFCHIITWHHMAGHYVLQFHRALCG